MRSLDLTRVDRLVLLGAHCDDLPIGVGATLLSLAAHNPGLEVDALVMTGGGTPREQEERRALAAFLPGATVRTTVLDLPDGRLPEHWGAVKDALALLARRSSPDLVLAPQRGDAHQDHRLVAELCTTVFRDHLVLGYEILKWESDLPRTTVYQPVPSELAGRKADLLQDCYPSQAHHDWFDRESFLGLMRLRGAQCHSRYAEAFVAEKIVLSHESQGD